MVLAGAASSGAYTAGVLDFLLDALDAWYAEKALNARSVPSHDVVIRVITGASAGALNAAIFTAWLGRRRPCASRATGDAGVTGNPFFDAWVDGVDIDALCGTRDLLPGRHAASILDTTHPRHVAARVLDPGDAEHLAHRPAYVARSLRVRLTLTNLDGVGYFTRIKAHGESAVGHGMRTHQDHVRFTFRSDGSCVPDYPDESVLVPDDDRRSGTWARLRDVAVASGAYPGLFAAQRITARSSDYAHRVWLERGAHISTFAPSSPSAHAQAFEFDAIDGGATCNEPLTLAHDVLAGALGSNPRGGTHAIRALIMVDPFPDDETVAGRTRPRTHLLSTLLGLAGAWMNQARFDPRALALALDDEVYSRFLIAPRRKSARDETLETGTFGGFGGLFARSRRAHDFFLGRRNCQRFLARQFVLPESNALFDGWRENPAFDDLRVREGDTSFLPIIPLIGPARATVEALVAPSSRDEHASVIHAIERLLARADALVEHELGTFDTGFFERFLLTRTWHCVRRRIRGVFELRSKPNEIGG